MQNKRQSISNAAYLVNETLTKQVYCVTTRFIVTVSCTSSLQSVNCLRLFRPLIFHMCYSISQFLEENWRRGHYTLTRVKTGSRVWCLQYDDSKIVTGHWDHTIKVGSCWCVVLPLKNE